MSAHTFYTQPSFCMVLAMLHWISQLTIKRWAIFIGILTFGVYVIHCKNGFVSLDDNYLIYENNAVKSITPQTITHIFTSYDPQLYIPLTFISYQLNVLLFGMSAPAFHIVNVLLHIGNAIVFLYVAFALTGKKFVAVTATLLFALHPINTEAVLWASARKDVLAGFFFLLSFYSYVRYREYPYKNRLLLSLLFFVLALLSKVSVIVLPFLLLLLDWYEGRKWEKEVWKEKIPFFVLCVLFGIIAIIGKTGVLGSSGFLQNMLLASRSSLFYIRKIIWPDFFSVIYPQTTPVTLTSLEFFVPLLIMFVIGVTLVVGLWTRKWKHVVFGLLWYLLLLAPSSPNFSKNGFIFFASDRYAYVASLGIFFLLGLLAHSVLEKIKTEERRGVTQFLIIIGVLIVLIPRTVAQGSAWSTSEAMYRHVLTKYPEAAMAHNNLGMELEEQGKREEAIVEIQKAIELSPQQSIPYFNLAAIHGKEGEIEKAIDVYKMIIPHVQKEELTSENELLRFFWLHDKLVSLQRPEEALRVLQKIAELAPWSAEAHYRVGVALQENERREEALRELERAEQLRPQDLQTLFHLAELYSGAERAADAKRVVEKAARIDPENVYVKKLLENIH